MDKQTKVKIIIFGVLAIAILSIILIIVSMVNKQPSSTKNEAFGVNLLSQKESAFTVEDMIKVNSDVTQSGSNSGSILSQRKERTFGFDSESKQNSIYEEEDDDIKLLQEQIRENETRKKIEVRTNNYNPSTIIQQSQPVMQQQPIQAKTPIQVHPKSTEPSVSLGPSREETTNIEELTEKKQNRFFRGEQKRITGNTISAVVHGEQIVTNGSTLKMRLLEELNLSDEVSIPRGTYIYGIVNINEERINVNIQSVMLGKNIYPIKRNVYDQDGLIGINVPENLKAEIAKKATAQAIQETDANIGSGNVLQKGANAVGNAAKNLLSKDAQEIKVTIKSNYRLYLK